MLPDGATSLSSISMRLSSVARLGKIFHLGNRTGRCYKARLENCCFLTGTVRIEISVRNARKQRNKVYI